eukprot:5860140-Pyramimonas_sp.AAC.1
MAANTGEGGDVQDSQKLGSIRRKQGLVPRTYQYCGQRGRFTARGVGSLVKTSEPDYRPQIKVYSADTVGKSSATKYRITIVFARSSGSRCLSSGFRRTKTLLEGESLARRLPTSVRAQI